MNACARHVTLASLRVVGAACPQGTMLITGQVARLALGRDGEISIHCVREAVVGFAVTLVASQIGSPVGWALLIP